MASQVHVTFFGKLSTFAPAHFMSPFHYKAPAHYLVVDDDVWFAQKNGPAASTARGASVRSLHSN
jgi:hypothetical protein